jgi:hypothetical protein
LIEGQETKKDGVMRGKGRSVCQGGVAWEWAEGVVKREGHAQRLIPQLKDRRKWPVVSATTFMRKMTHGRRNGM